MSIKLIAIIGKSGSGKNTILNRFTKIPYLETELTHEVIKSFLKLSVLSNSFIH